MFGTIQRKIRNKTRKDAQIIFYRVIVAAMLIHENWALSRSESRKTEIAEMRFSWRVSGNTFTDHVRNTAIRKVLQIYALEEIIRDYKNK
jgi:hypothetical protein